MSCSAMLPGISEIIETLQYNYRRRQNGEKMEKTEYDYLKQKENTPGRR